MESSAIQLLIDAVNENIAKLRVKLEQIQQKQENLMIEERSLIESQVQYESKKLQVSTLCFLLLIHSDSNWRFYRRNSEMTKFQIFQIFWA